MISEWHMVNIKEWVSFSNPVLWAFCKTCSWLCLLAFSLCLRVVLFAESAGEESNPLSSLL